VVVVVVVLDVDVLDVCVLECTDCRCAASCVLASSRPNSVVDSEANAVPASTMAIAIANAAARKKTTPRSVFPTNRPRPAVASAAPEIRTPP